ncbi:penicillin binding protein PBP4B [Pseudoalteromonas sp. T1lg75]|uniref:penicillin binding protein PBP4B n=1 Tax=Pseudoalteromonas sp. T1lg75 TaxID=2077102 RepID=UPI000CF605A1|nr:penicillin binding protein PBP4B [Pseudoalteromonas sp. T1lg75]
MDKESLQMRCKSLLSLPLLFLLSSCSSGYDFKQSQNYSKRIKFLVMHYTAIDYEKSERVLVEKGGLSAHYLVPESLDPSYGERELQVLQLVKEQDRAWHAGNSYWQGRSDLNDHSIGIEVVNVPSCSDRAPSMEPEISTIEYGAEPFCVFPDYDPKQIELLIALSQDILARNPDIGPTQVVGHADIAPGRKLDPGPRFPWYQLYKAGIGAWYQQQDVEYYWRHFSAAPPSVAVIQQALADYGYGIAVTARLDQQTLDVLKAFQTHFLPWQVNAQADGKTAAVLFALLKRYKSKKADKNFALYQELAEQPQEFAALGHEQLYIQYPQQELSSRVEVNNKYQFKSYRRRGEIIIDNISAERAEILINGETINIARPLKAGHSYRYSLARRTRDGVNTLHIKSVFPEDATLSIRIPAPELRPNPGAIDFAAVDTLIAQEVEQGFPGAVLGVVYKGELVKLSAYGYARAHHGKESVAAQPMTEGTLFDIASNTKMFATNLALMHLVSQGRLDVNKPISHYLAEYTGQGREVRLVKDLLTHSAGYPAVVDFHRTDNHLGRPFYSLNSERTKQLLIRGVPFEMMRAQRHLYSDVDYMLLGVLIERITNMPLDAYVESRLYAPLGLNTLIFNPLQKGFMPSQIAATEIEGNTRGGRVNFEGVRDYVLQGEVHDEKAFYSLGGVAGHAGLFADVQSVAKLTQLLLNRGSYGEVQLIRPEVVDQFIKPTATDESYGLGWRRAGNGARRWHFGPYASPRAYGHTGWTGTVTVIDPEYDLAIVLFTNARHSEVTGSDSDYRFKGKEFETGKYGSVITRVYEAILAHDK